jgi:hypothetical protein
MSRTTKLKNGTKNRIDLARKYPPSTPCSCDICRNYCRRPGWWTVAEAARAIAAGLGERMMLEMSPELTFGVLAPAYQGSEGKIALHGIAHPGCTFLKDDLCELYGTGLQPLECRFCHHTRPGQGEKCHAELEKDWYSQAGQKLVIAWGKASGFFERQGIILESKQ